MTLGAANIAILTLALGLAGAGCIGKGLDTEPESYPDSYSYGDPRTVSGLRVWLVADYYRSYYSSGTTVSSGQYWPNQGTLSFSMSPVAADEPIYSTSSGLGGVASVLNFGLSEQLQTGSAGFGSGATAVTIMVLARRNAAGAGEMLGFSNTGSFTTGVVAGEWMRISCPSSNCFLEHHATNQMQTSTGGVSVDFNYRLHTAIWDGSLTVGQRLYHEVSSTGSSTGSANTSSMVLANTLNIGRAGNYFSGNIAEVLIWDRALTTAERAQISAYLSGKYSF